MTNSSNDTSASTKPEATIDIELLTPTIGAVIRGVDLSQQLTEAQYDAIEKAFYDHLVLYFRDQKITREDQKRFGRHFGELNIHPFLPKVEDDPHVILLENDRARPPAVNIWHADLTFMEKPPLGSVLLARHVPDVGGDTLWADMYAAYEGLSDKMQRTVSDLVAVHKGFLAEYRAALGDLAPLDPQSEWADPEPTAEHPIVRTHPVTGKRSLFISSADTREIKDMKSNEAEALLKMLFRHAQTPEYQVRFRWHEGDVAFWDNRCTQHYANADYWPNKRTMHRVTIEGDRPY